MLFRSTYVTEKKSVVDLGLLGPNAKIGWYVPKFVVDEHPELATWEGFMKPELAKLFATAETGDLGQFLMGDVSWGGIQRFFVEKVGNDYQGAGFVFTGGLESGVYRMAQGPDGMLYLGMIGTSNDWSWNGQYYGLQKIKIGRAHV